LFLAGPALLAWTPSVHATDADLATFYASDDRR
jgi:hypothetical protein